MTKSSVALLAIVCATSAQAQIVGTPWKNRAILPPPQYDQFYPGRLAIVRLATEDEVRAICSNARWVVSRAMACARHWGLTRCDIYIAADDVLAQVGLTFEVALRHELGHCNGWPAHHPDARFLVEPPRRYPVNAPQMTLDDYFNLKVAR